MLQVISCLAYEHDYRALLLATAVCVFGSLVAMRLFVRTRRSSGAKRAVWLFQAGVVTGAVIWTTHFIAMLGYEPPLQHAYDPVLTLLSLFVAIGFCFAGMSITASTRSSILIEVGGAVLGIGIAAMHFTGMAAFRVTGHFEWDPVLVVSAIVFGAFFGALAMNRTARPVTRFCKYGGTIALILAIVSMHFTAMGAITIVPDLSVAVPEKLISNQTMIVGVLAVMSLIMGTAIGGHALETQTQDEALQRYRHLALHDAITGLPNRAYLISKLGENIATADSQMTKVAVIGIDLDRFKDINDVHGHAAGDAVLTSIASRLSDMLEDGEFIARIGGDEFVAVKSGFFSSRQLTDFAERARGAICQPSEYQGASLSVGASLGISVYPKDGENADDLLSRADLAMYRAKSSALEKICRYDSSMDESGRLRAALAMELRYALERGELELFYQPQNDVASGRLIGFEALLRWNHPTRGLVSPAEFIPIAESTGLILPIGEWVLRAACREAASWSQPLKIAVNVASAQFSQSDLPRIVHETLLETGLTSSRLELEITESSIIEDHQKALHVVRQLKSFGVTIAMDDYGTGYSSLSTLQTFPFDKIKIDRSFVNAITSSAQASAIVKSTIILADSLNIPVLAEGVESEDHLTFLRNEGCHEAQGYLFGRPLPVGQARDAIAKAETGSASQPTEPAKVMSLPKQAAA